MSFSFRLHYLIFFLLVYPQVLELHRLYRMQKTLMLNLSWEEFDRYDSRNPTTESSLFTYINPARYEPLAKEARISSIPKVNEGVLVISSPLTFGCLCGIMKVHKGFPYYKGSIDEELRQNLKLSSSWTYKYIACN